MTSAKENNKTTINTFGIFEKIFPVVPGIKYIGMKAAIVVSIVINTGELTSIAPSIAAFELLLSIS